MCDIPNVFSALALEAPEDAALPLPPKLAGAGQAHALRPEDIRLGSRRRRLWELPSQALCPVIGVCLPMPMLRRRMARLSAANQQASDYELHCRAIDACAQRSALAELLQRELDQRFVRTIRLSAQCKTSMALAQWWNRALQDDGSTSSGAGLDVADCFWSVLTHARCDPALQEQVLRDIHMLQHQVGAANRADLRRLEQLQDENAVLGKAYAQVQQRSTALLQERAACIERQAAELMHKRAELLGRDTLIASLREQIQMQESAAPGLRSRLEQAAQIREQLERIQDLERALQQSRLQTEQQRQRAEERQAELNQLREAQDQEAGLAAQAEGGEGGESASGLAAAPASEVQQLSACAVLCVGGRQAVVPVYRQLIERTGGRFLHHDGGEEDAVAMLDASLAAADLVICQTGCISHDAYWRVKDHCKRHGKRCVFVDKPSASSLQRALDKLGAAGRERPGD